MPRGKKRPRPGPGSTNYPKNKYSDNPPDFDRLATLYPSFKPYVFYSSDGRPRIDWTDYNATRELTRILLLHDHGVDWWIPDGQLCPAVPNRSNYIHWIEDLISSDVIRKSDGNEHIIRGFDIGTGANCIYPLLGASLLGWKFVGSDVTDVALEWAERNVRSNPHLLNLIEIRKVENLKDESCKNETENPELANGECKTNLSGSVAEEVVPVSSSSSNLLTNADKTYSGPPILLGIVRENEKFDFCMCNPPFFEALEEAGLNPNTSCGGTPEEMVCQGGEKAFITRLIEDSVALRQKFRWYTSMLGKKSNLKFLISKLREVGVTVLKTTEFVQGRTSRWGLAWSFMPPVRKVIAPHVAAEKSVLSFMLEGIPRQFSAINVLQSIEEFFQSSGICCKSNTSTFSVDILASEDQCNMVLKKERQNLDSAASYELVQEISHDSSFQVASTNLSFRVSVFQQIPGTLLIKASLHHKDSPLSGLFFLIFGNLEEDLKSKFSR